MKKLFYVAAAFLAAGFVGCSENDDNGVNQNVNDERAEIRFTAGDGRVDIKQNAPATRGTGAVGDVEGEKNIWRGEELNVSMFIKDTFEPAIDEFKNSIFANTVVKAPASTADQTTEFVYADYSANGVKYYPMSGEFDFFAYRADDAVVANPDGTTGPQVEGENMVVPVVINGTQDLMVAKAAPTADQSTAYAEKNGKEERIYSAYSARKGLQPHFTFEHLLSRLVFYVKPNTEKEVDVLVKAIRIKGVEYKKDTVTYAAANTDAKFIVAWKGEKPDSLILEASNPNGTDIELMQKVAGETEAHKLVALTPVKPVWENGAAANTRVGESMLLIPAENYVMEVDLEQVDKNGTPVPNTLRNVLTLKNGAGFKPGQQYHINITVYGLEEIKLELELTPWEYVPGDNDVDVDDDAE